MGLLTRCSFVIRSKLSSFISSMEDPAAQLDYSYQQLTDELQTVKTALADVTKAKKRQEIRASNLEDEIESHNEQARKAVQNGRDDLARNALERKNEKVKQLETILDAIQTLDKKQSQIEEQKESLKTQIQQFRTRKETLKARHKAAQSSSRAQEIITGVDSDIGQQIEDLDNKIEEQEARAEALEELDETNQLTDESSLEQELEQQTKEQQVQSELQMLKTNS